MESSARSDDMKIEKLNGSNYISWKFNMKLLLMEKDLYGFIDGTEKPPEVSEEDKKEKEMKLYTTRSQKAYSTIALAVTKPLQVHVMNTVCPKTAWNTLKSHFEFVSITQIVRVNRAFFAAKMMEETDLIEHITHMTYLAEQMRELGEEVSQKKFAVVVLGSLPDSYDNFMTSLNARDANKFSWEDVKPALMEEYLKRKEKGEKRKNEDAYFVGGYGNNHRGGAPPPRGGGFRGGRGGRGGGRIGNRGTHHFDNSQGNSSRGANFQPIGARGGARRGPQGGFNTYQNQKDCWDCGEIGHISAQCPLKDSNDESANIADSRGGGVQQNNKRIKIEEENVFLESDIALVTTTSDNVQERSCTNEDWFVDSAASAHMTYDKNVIQQYVEYDEPQKVFLGNDTWISSAGEGKVRLPVIDNNKVIFLALHRVVFVPELAKNLLSVKSMTQNDAQVIFDKEKCVIVPPQGGPQLTIAHASGNLYKVNISMQQQDYANFSSIENNDINIYDNSGTNVSSQQIWHARFGHLNAKYVHHLASKQLVEGISLNDKTLLPNNEVLDCEACTLAKMHRSSFPKQSQHRATRILELIHSDLCGPMQVDSIGGSRYMLTFTDDYSRYTHVYFLKKKSEVLEKFKEFVTLAENMSGSKVGKLNVYAEKRVSFKNFRTDNGGEYTSNDFHKYCSEKGIAREFTNPHTPQQNGVSERLNRTIIEAVRSMMFHANVPLFLWAEAVSSAVYIHNRSPTAALTNTTPYECWFQEKPNVSNLRVFGCLAYYLVPDAQRKKLDPKSRKAIFIGYPAGTKGYKLYDVATGSFVRSRNIKFFESKFHNFDDKRKIDSENFVIFPVDDIIADNSLINYDPALPQAEIVEHIDQQNEPHQVTTNLLTLPGAAAAIGNPVQPTNDNIDNTTNNNNVMKTYEETFMQQVQNLNGKRGRKERERLIESVNLVDECNLVESLTSNINEPNSIKDALNSEHSAEWNKALQAEYNSLLENKTWELVPRPKDINIVGSRWLFKLKRNGDGSINRFKSRLVAQGFTQTHGVDYGEVFSPVARMAAIRSLLALANVHNWEIHQMDVRTAFLNGILDYDVYMEQPEGFIDAEHPDYVCKLKRSLYGLKQSARCWNSTLDSYLEESGYRPCSADGCLYIKTVKSSNGKISFVILPVFVDDFIPVSNDTEMLRKEKVHIFRTKMINCTYFISAVVAAPCFSSRTVSGSFRAQSLRLRVLGGLLPRCDDISRFGTFRWTR